MLWISIVTVCFLSLPLVADALRQVCTRIENVTAALPHTGSKMNKSIPIPVLDSVAGVASEDYPWFVSTVMNELQWVGCGGTLISPTRVLTAAHCFVGDNGEIDVPEQVRVGPTNVTNGEVVEVSCVSIHPGFHDLVYNDVAIIKLSKPTSSQAFVRLSSSTQHPSDHKVTSLGFGIDCCNSSFPRNLKANVEKVMETSDCQRSFETKCYQSTGRSLKWTITAKTHVCTQRVTGGSYYGDSGGPLIDAEKAQIGIISFGGAESTNLPNAYTNVQHHLDWIKEEMTSNKCTIFHDESPPTVSKKKRHVGVPAKFPRKQRGRLNPFSVIWKNDVTRVFVLGTAMVWATTAFVQNSKAEANQE